VWARQNHQWHLLGCVQFAGFPCATTHSIFSLVTSEIQTWWFRYFGHWDKLRLYSTSGGSRGRFGGDGVEGVWSSGRVKLVNRRHFSVACAEQQPNIFIHCSRGIWFSLSTVPARLHDRITSVKNGAWGCNIYSVWSHEIGCKNCSPWSLSVCHWVLKF
jgi:hypothetical protein